MAVLSVPSLLHGPVRATQQQLSKRNSSRTSPNVALCCQNYEPGDPEKITKKKEKGRQPPPPEGILGRLEKLGKGLRNNLSPQKKGDWKDLTLMSLSFAVYVYISQKIVCAYYAWMSMPKQPW
ncbi:hypothetical protein SAY87_006801 [Trapa incisa]|uniref:Uncharacterized protein n=1 Tax=Trapa incisa TaxID=236973 RepID=A0AAN7K1T3_9MYRT|nr:hypothetical protein SAY87_006801 [Trapa incisa]